MSGVVPNRLIVVDLRVMSEKKNTIRFDSSAVEEENRSANVQNIYIKKTALAAAFGGWPKKGVRVTIEALT